jgi:lantibiotic modifying enzyme
VHVYTQAYLKIKTLVSCCLLCLNVELEREISVNKTKMHAKTDKDLLELFHIQHGGERKTLSKLRKARWKQKFFNKNELKKMFLRDEYFAIILLKKISKTINKSQKEDCSQNHKKLIFRPK